MVFRNRGFHIDLRFLGSSLEAVLGSVPLQFRREGQTLILEEALF